MVDPEAPGPYVPAAHPGVAFYKATREFRSHVLHVVVRNRDTGEVVAVTGPVLKGDELNTLEALCEAVVYCQAFPMLELVKAMAQGSLPMEAGEARAREILQALQKQVEAIPDQGPSPRGLRRVIHYKLGLYAPALARGKGDEAIGA